MLTFKGGTNLKDSELKFDRTCHVLYSKKCKKQIQSKIALHYAPEEREKIWEKVQLLYSDFLSDWRTDLGGKKNFHNGKGENYDCVALGLTTHEKIKRNAIVFKLCCIPGYIAYVLVCVYAVNGASGFLNAFLQLLFILSVMNLIDRFLVDDFWVGHTKAWVIPGTEDLRPYIGRRDKVIKWLFGTVGMAVISAAPSGIMMIFVW